MANTIGKSCCYRAGHGRSFQSYQNLSSSDSLGCFLSILGGGKGFKFSRKPSLKELSSYQFLIAGSSQGRKEYRVLGLR